MFKKTIETVVEIYCVVGSFEKKKKTDEWSYLLDLVCIFDWSEGLDFENESVKWVGLLLSLIKVQLQYKLLAIRDLKNYINQTLLHLIAFFQWIPLKNGWFEIFGNGIAMVKERMS